MAPRHTGSRPKYVEIADDLRSKIESGTYPVGAQLPTKAELMAEHQAALNTVDRAIDVLRDAGLAISYQGVGTFVREPGEHTADEADTQGRLTALETRIDRLEALIMDIRANIGLPDHGREDDKRVAQSL
jgi:DNA-binding GntR family transcriptional regulator